MVLGWHRDSNPRAEIQYHRLPPKTVRSENQRDTRTNEGVSTWSYTKPGQPFIIRSLIRVVPLFAIVGLAHSQDRWSFATSDTSLNLRVTANQPVITSLSPVGGGPEWLAGGVPVPLPDHAVVNHASQKLQWKFLGRAESPEAGETILRFASEEPNLELLSIWRAQPGPGPVEHHFELVNRSGQGIELPLQPSQVLTLTAPADHALENWWVEKGAGRPSNAGTHREPIGDGYRFAGRSTPYAKAAEMIPWLSIQDTMGRAGVYLGIEFSGRVGFDVSTAGNPLTAGLDPAEREFRSGLADGERFVTPTVFVGCYRGGVDDGANRLHRFVAAHLRPPVSDARYPLVVNNSWGSGMAVDEALARRMIDDSAVLGAELFHIDAGWFQTVGDWHPNGTKFPHGLATVADYVHSKGMLFGLWVGWTQGGTAVREMETLAVTNPKQRDWFTRDYPPGWKPSDFTGAPVCLGAAPARDWCLSELRRIVTSYKLDLLEHDQVMIVDQCNRTDHGHTASPADIAYHAALGYYCVYDQLRQEHPALLFEDCVNGGRTVDFGIVRRTHYISITDTYDPMSNRRAFYDASYPLPPAMCECYVQNKPGPSLATFRTMLRSGMMGWFTLMCDTGAWSRDQHEAARRQIEIYKQWIRPLINHGDLYHISARPDEARWDGMEYWDAHTGKGAVFIFRGAKAAETNHTFKLQGLNRTRSYQVWSEDGAVPRTQASGAKLMGEGLRMDLSEPGASELVYLLRE
jgi:alpha-galactosidase